MVKEVSMKDMKAYLKEDFTTGFMCSESVLDTLNKFFELGISEEAIGLSTGFPYGFGDGGNVCGGVAGATMALGKLFGRTVKGDPAYEKCIAVVRELNDEVIKAYETTICPALIEDYQFATPERKEYCTNLLYVVVEAFARIMEREFGVVINE